MKIEGKDAVVIGRSNIVGIPVSLLLMQRNATVTIAHSRTADIEAVVRRADIVVAAVGRAEFVKGSWLKPGAVVIGTDVLNAILSRDAMENNHPSIHPSIHPSMIHLSHFYVLY